MKRGMYVITLILSISILVLTGCINEKESDLSNSSYDFKTKYVGDNSKVIGVVQNLSYPKHTTYKGLEIKSSKEPYALDVFIETERELRTSDLFKNAAVTFSLIGNLTNLNYLEEDTNKVLISYNRQTVEKKLKADGDPPLKEIGKSQKSINDYLKK